LKLKSFQIENFRSINNVKCHIAQDITVLAGKNESGKTNILDALTALNEGKKFVESDRPLNKGKDIPVFITYNFQLCNEEKEKCIGDFPIRATEVSDLVTITVDHDKDEYEISGNLIDDIGRKLYELDQEKKHEINNKIEAINLILIESKLEKISSMDSVSVQTLDNTIAETEKKSGEIPRNPKTNQPSDPDLAEKMSTLLNLLKDIQNQEETIKDKVWELRPKVVKFITFEDLLPPTVPFDQFTEEGLKNNYKIVYNLGKLADLDFDRIRTSDIQIRENLAERGSRISTTKFLEFWKQNPVEFIFRIYEPTVSIFIRDKGKESSYKPEQRSKGFQWFLSFYLRLEAEGTEKDNIILIDEPGLYLHAKAQRDVLKVLEKESKNNQIIFTTHSPYLIDPNELNRIRLVVKNEDSGETIITNSYHKGADFDTLTPIITAIGLDISRDLLFSKELNLVLEGISDYYYLRSMIEILKRKNNYDFPENISLIPCVGNTNVGLILALLMGLGLQYRVILDQKGSKKTFNKLKRDGMKDNEIIFVGKNENESIEDLFSISDKEKYGLNSTEASKAVISRNFYEKVKSGEFTEFTTETIENFKNIIEKIKDALIPSFDLEKMLTNVENYWDDIAEKIAIKYSIPLSEEDKEKLITKYSTTIKKLRPITKEQADLIFDQFVTDLKAKNV